MASNAKSVILLVIMVTTFMLVASQVSPPDSTILKVCKHTLDPDFCLSSLRSYPGAQMANISQLAVITANMAFIEAKNVSGFIVELSRREGQGNGSLFSAAIMECVTFYEQAVFELQESLSVLRKPIGKDKGLVNSLQSGALTDVSSCLDEVTQWASRLAPLVKARSQNLEKMIDNALSASNLLYNIGLL